MFPRAQLRRFNEASENTPGVGSYNITEAGSLNVERNRSMKKLNALQVEKNDLDANFRRVHDELCSLKASHFNEVTKFNEEIAHHKKQFSSVISEMYAKTMAYEELKSQKVFVEEELRTLKIDQPRLNDLVHSAQSELSALKKQHKEENIRLTEITNLKQKELDEYSAQKAILEKDLSTLEANFNMMQSENKGLREKVDSAQSELSALKKQHKEENIRLTEITNLKQKELDEYSAQKAILEKDLSTLEANFNMMQSENKELREKVDSAQSEICALKEQQEQELKELEKINDLKEDELDKLKSQKAILEKDLSALQIRFNSIQTENREIKEETSSAQSEICTLRQQHEQEMKNLADIINLKEDELSQLKSQKAILEKDMSALQIRFNSIQTENKEMKEETTRKEAFVANLKKESEQKVRNLEMEKDYQEKQYREMMSEMSEKIQQLEEDGANNSVTSQEEGENCWKERYEELQQKMEPFKEIIDAYEVERKLIEDRDKFTQEQIDKLQQEAIKNMGHQNHKQKVKYVNSIKQENIALHQKYQESQEELFRQTALVKKCKQKIDSLEGGKAGIGRPDVKSRPKVPLKDGNR